MAFWGVEVKPGKSYIHHYNDDQGRLHLSQATLGTGSSAKKSILQCSVGDKQPIYLCSLLPEKVENCPLNLEFDEDEEVTFSVIGPHTIHLSGFFFGENEDGGESDDFGGQIIESDSESDDSIDYDMEDEDDDESLDDDDLGMYPSSPVRKSGVKIEEIVDDENPNNENGISKQTKKKKSQTSKSSADNGDSQKQIVKGGSAVAVLESEDEDGFPISSPGDEQDKNKDKNDVVHEKSLKRKIAAVDQDGEGSRGPGKSDLSVQIDNASAAKETKQNKKNKKKKSSDKEEMTHEGDSKSDMSKGVGSGDLEQNVDREKEKEKKKKKKKKQENSSNAENSATDKSVSTIEAEEKAEAKPFQVRSFPNGLVIEELSMGKPDGKKAAPGKKVSVRYIGKLKKNGKIFDSNIGRAPFKFRLGIGEVIKGWDVGVNGMRVGDKRRLTIPPAMGYGARGAGGAIPPNSWLVFDVELMDVN
ncbi:hypothetical protein M9H77_10556 [Catharanthus roseus]|uniref:Uncharacterized protein n=1 Tax=Catharanthus roseus TaxID=4058 RepID=A0ACC0BC47_CATRO|nr:hypothetical protein M9H77_10556 [Catharanthus roseus]